MEGAKREKCLQYQQNALDTHSYNLGGVFINQYENYKHLYNNIILIAPIIYEGAVSREIYLPEGSNWTDAHGGEIYSGGQMITVHAPIEIIPVFLRDGKQEYIINKI